MVQLRRTWCAMLLVLFAAGAVQADEAITLRYKMKKGDQFIYRTVTKTKQVQDVNNMKFNTELTNTDVSQRTVEKIDEKGNFHLKTENKRLQLKMEVTQLGEYKYDSTSSERETGSTLSAAQPYLRVAGWCGTHLHAHSTR